MQYLETQWMQLKYLSLKKEKSIKEHDKESQLFNPIKEHESISQC